MATEPKAKIHVGADTSDFDKGAKSVKQGLRDLDKVGGDALASLGEAFGVNTGKVNQMTSAVVGLGQKLSQSGNAGVKAFGDILKSIGPVQAGIAGLGLAAAAAGFRALKAEADNFKSTIDGLNLSMATETYISTYRQAMHDANAGVGQSIGETMSGLEKRWARFTSNAGAFLATWIGDKETVGIVDSWRKVADASRAATKAAEEGEVLGNQMADLKKRELTLTTEIAEKDRDIAEQMRIARDNSKSAAERSAAEEQARTLINEKYAAQIQMAKDMASVQERIDGLANNDYEATKNTEAAKQRVLALEAQQAQELAGIDRLSNRISNSASTNADAWQKAREEAEKLAELHARGEAYGAALAGGLASISTPGVTGPTLSILPQRQDIELFKSTLQAYMGDFQLSIGFKADTEQIRDITNEVNSLVESGVTRSAELIGGLVGTLAGGGDAWGDFKDAALSTFGDMAIAVGKIAIQEGLAIAGIQAALKSGQWYLAVAAGAALVALGSAVKSSLSAVASGDYSAGGGYSGGNYSSSSGNYESREINVNVTGSLEADGDKLLAVIGSANKKNYYIR